MTTTKRIHLVFAFLFKFVNRAKVFFLFAQEKRKKPKHSGSLSKKTQIVLLKTVPPMCQRAKILPIRARCSICLEMS